VKEKKEIREGKRPPAKLGKGKEKGVPSSQKKRRCATVKKKLLPPAREGKRKKRRKTLTGKVREGFRRAWFEKNKAAESI